MPFEQIMPISLKRCYKNVVMMFAWIAFAVSGAATAFAQSESRSPKGTVTFNSNPPGAVIYLSGEYRFWGRTPFVLPYNLFGRYRIQANRRGYEEVVAVYNFTGESKGALTLKLSPKTPAKALYRSLLFPGWGQYYSERKFVGILFVGATAGAFVALTINENLYQNAKNGYLTALASYNLSLSQGDINAQNANFVILQRALQSFNDTKDSRNSMLYAIAGVWVFNALESVIFFPNFSDIEFFEKLSPKFSQTGNGVKLSLQFSID
jgi:hypothetical protein